MLSSNFNQKLYKIMKKVPVLLKIKAQSSSRSRSRTTDKEYDSKKINADPDPAMQYESGS
jgi:hypothetical protein